MEGGVHLREGGKLPAGDGRTIAPEEDLRLGHNNLQVPSSSTQQFSDGVKDSVFAVQFKNHLRAPFLRASAVRGGERRRRLPRVLK
jgi:hypothetical protein